MIPFTPFKDPKPKMSVRKIKSIARKLSLYELYDSKDMKDLCLAFYELGFKDGVKAHKKEVSKHCNKFMDYFGI